MSYINEALKKAQKEKDAKGANYIESLETSGEISRSFYKRNIYYALIIIFLIVLIISLKSWPDFFSNKKESITGKRQLTKEKATDQNPEKNEKTGTGPADMDGSMESGNNPDLNLFNRAVSLARENRIEEAKLTYRKILSLNPGHIKALNDLGVLLLHEGRYEPAVSYFEKAVRLNPDNVDPYYNLACVFALSGDKKKGMAYLIKAVELDSRVKEWIKMDTDLEGLKDLPEFKEILK